MLTIMRQAAVANLVLTILWVAYAVTAAGLLYDLTPPLSRPLLLILGGYGALLAVATVIIFFGRRHTGDPGGA
jgi:hypothetical protein